MTGVEIAVAPMLPTAEQVRAESFLDDLASQTGAASAALYRFDELGRVLDRIHGPAAGSRRMLLAQVEPAVRALAFLTNLHGMWWTVRPGSAIPVPDSQLLASPCYHYIHRLLGERHIAVCAQAVREDGSQVVVMIARNAGRNFEAADLRVFERHCGSRANRELLAAVFADGDPRLAKPSAAEQTAELDGYLRPIRYPLYLQALLASFFGPPPRSGPDAPVLPGALEDLIRKRHSDSAREFLPGEEDYSHVLVHRHRGRQLCIHVSSRETGGLRLSVQEDFSQYSRLRRIKSACRALSRDRSNVFYACLLVAEGIRSPGEIARQAGFQKLKATSAARLVNRARAIVESI